MADYKNRKNCSSCLIPREEPKQEVKQEIINPCKPFAIKNISCVNGKIIVTFDDCTYLEANEDVVDISVAHHLQQDLTEKLNEVSDRLTMLESSIIDIQDLEGNVSFKALKP